MRKAVMEALRSLGALEQAVSGWRDEDQQLLQKQRQHLEVLANHVGYFRLGEEENPAKPPT